MCLRLQISNPKGKKCMSPSPKVSLCFEVSAELLLVARAKAPFGYSFLH